MKHADRVLMLPIFCLLVLLSVSAQAKQGYHIIFKIPGADKIKGTIGYFEGSAIVKIDSSYFDSGIITFKGEKEIPEGLYVLQTDGKNMDFIVSEKEMTIELRSAENLADAAITGSPSNNIYFSYKKFMLEKKQEVRLLRKKSASDPSLKSKINKVGNLVKLYQDSLYRKYPGMLAAKIIRAEQEVKLNMFPEAVKLKQEQQNSFLKKHLFDNLDLKDERMVRTPYLEENIIRSLKLTAFEPDSLARTCDFILEKTTGGKEAYRYTLNFLKNYFGSTNRPWMDVMYTYIAKKYYLKGKAPWADSSEILTIRSDIKRMDPILTGKVAPEINFMDSSGRLVPLYGVKAKLTVLYFWDADCEHCQVITPQLWDYYNEVKSRGVEVYAVTIQQVYHSWKEYIKKHKLTWINVFDPVNIPEVYKTYQVGSTPGIYLLDEKKRILCKKISLDELKNYVDMILPVKNNQ